MKRWIILIVIALAVTAGVLAVVRPFGRNGLTVEIETAGVTRGDISDIITATGTLEALETVEVGTQVSGVIEHIFVDYNSQVKTGQLLARLDETPLLATLEQSQASVEDAQAELDYQESNYERYKVLSEKNLIAQSDFDQVEYNYRKARAALKNAKSVYNRNKINLEYATIYSPIDGIILDRAVDEGQTVAASFNTPTLFTIANDLTRMQVEASVDEADIGMVREGQRVEFEVDAFPDLKFEGSVTQIRLQPVESSNVITYTVVIDAPNPDKKLMPGMTANVSFYVTEKKNILVIPAKAVYFDPDPELWASYRKKHPEMEVIVPEATEGDVASAAGQDMPARPALSGSRNMPGNQDISGSREMSGSQEMSGSREMSGSQEMQGVPPSPGMEGRSGTEDSNNRVLWVKEDNRIMSRTVVLGETDEVNYEVLSGLEEGEQVVVALSSVSGGGQPEHTDSEARSPFMPQRPGENRR
jgi:HlyD family secretion protein